MNCHICGSQLPCIHVLHGRAVANDDERSSVDLPGREGARSIPSEQDANWRKEVASRVQQHRYRRGRSDDSVQSMELEFAADEALTVTDGPVIRALHRRTLADSQPAIGGDAELEDGQKVAVPDRPRVIRFPRSLASLHNFEQDDVEPDLPASVANEPESSALPRIMDAAELTQPDELVQPAEEEPTRAPEQMELLPSFEDIHLDPAYTSAQPDLEIIPRPARLQERLVAGFVDLALVALAALLFGYAFVRMSEDAPHSRLVLPFAMCVGGILWIVFQYVFLVHGRGTPGMQLTDLELRTFDGRGVNANTRRIRAAASALSALSVGLGYAWAFVDEDQLGWHDRMTQTLLKSRSERSSMSAHPWDWRNEHH